MLGVTPGVVEKEMYRKASDPMPDGGEAAVASGGGYGVLEGLDPEMAEASRGMRTEQLEIRRLNLQAQRLKAQRELQLLQQAPGDNSGALILVIDKLGGLMQRVDQLATLAARQTAVPAVAAAPPANVLDKLAELKQGWETVQAISGGSKPPSTAVELEMTVALRRLSMEAEERQRRLDEDIEDRRAQRENDRIRSEAIAQQINQYGPIFAGALMQRMGGEAGSSDSGVSSGPAASPSSTPAPRPTARPALAVLQGTAGAAPLTSTPQGPAQYVEGRCPSCGAPLGIHPGPDDHCPDCGLGLSVVGGKIMPKMPKSDTPHYAS